jgi:hydroxysqualene dehydroxylase
VFHHPDQGFGRLQLPRLPAPWHLVTGILRFGLLPLRDRLGILRAGTALRAIGRANATAPGDTTILEWLHTQRQRPEAIRSFWEPLAVSIMNERIETAAAGPFLRALAAAFLHDPHDAAAMLPSVGLSRLFVDGARDYIASHGGTVRCGADVAAIRLVDQSAAGVLLRNGAAVDGDAVLLAVPWHQAHTLLPEIPDEPPPASSPILSIHLWFEHDFMPEPFVGLIGRRVQWIFNRRLFAPGEGKGGHLSAVISAAHDFVGLSNGTITAIALEDVRSAYDACPAAALRSVVIREKRATYSSRPAIERLRPGPVTRVKNMALAGDWTNTGLPATIEGAIISGERAALHLLREFGIFLDAQRQGDSAR